MMTFSENQIPHTPQHGRAMGDLAGRSVVSGRLADQGNKLRTQCEAYMRAAGRLDRSELRAKFIATRIILEILHRAASEADPGS